MSRRCTRARVAPSCAWATRTLRGRGVARGALAVDVGLGNEAARNQRLRAVELVLRELRVGAGDLDVGGELGGFLRLDRTVDGGEDLALADPAAGIDQHAGDHAAFAGDSDRLVAPRGKRAAGGDRARDLRAARDHDGDGRHLAAAAFGLRRPPALPRRRSSGKKPSATSAMSAAPMIAKRLRREPSSSTSVLSPEERIEVFSVHAQHSFALPATPAPAAAVSVLRE